MKATIKKTFSLILCLALGLGLSIGLSYVHAVGVWNDPATNPPDCNVTTGTPVPPNCDAPQPINVGIVDQVKGIAAFGGLGINELSAYQNAQLDAVTAFRALILGLPDPANSGDSALKIGDNAATVHVSLAGKEYTDEGGLYSDNIIAPTGTLKPLCSDKDGNVIICSDPPPPPLPPTSGVISGKLSFYCVQNSAGKYGYGKINIDFDNPTPVPMTIKVAECLDNPYFNSAGYLDECGGVKMIPGGLPSGYVDSSLDTLTMTVPTGSTFYTSPSPYWVDDRVMQPGWAPRVLDCLNNGKRRNTQVTKAAHIYMKPTSPSTGWTLQFSGTSYQPNFTSPVSFPVTQVP